MRPRILVALLYALLAASPASSGSASMSGPRCEMGLGKARGRVEVRARGSRRVERRELSIAVGGDVMFGRVTPRGWRAHPSHSLLGAWRETLQRADLAFINLETGICEQGRSRSPLPLLWAPPERLDVLRAAGIDAVSVANNHVLDCGPRGFERILSELELRGIAAAGVAPHGAVRVAPDVVAFAATFHPPPYGASGAGPLVATGGPHLLARVHSLRRAYRRQLLLVSLHWGKERSPHPAAWQRELARQLIDAGANAVVGHGPHVLQSPERHAGGIILYSLGNLDFDDTSAIGRPRGPVLLRFRRAAHGGWHLSPNARAGH